MRPILNITAPMISLERLKLVKFYTQVDLAFR